METHESRRREKGKARQRHIARKQKRQGQALPNPFGQSLNLPIRLPEGWLPADWQERLGLMMRDTFWYITHKPQVIAAVLVFVAVVLGSFVASHVFTGRIFPNVWAFGVSLGDMNVEEAESALLDAWTNQVRIALMIEEEQVATVRPQDLGMTLNARQTAEDALAVGMSGIPFGYTLTPVAEVDYITAQNYLLDLWNQLHIPAEDAGYSWEGNQVVGVSGKLGRELDVVLTLERLQQDPLSIAANQRLDLLMLPIEPDVIDPAPYLAEAQGLVKEPLQMMAYDPVMDDTIAWTTSQEEFARWLAAGQDGLTLRESTFKPFIEALNVNLNLVNEGQTRYLDEEETMESLRTAIADKQQSVTLRIRYLPSTYEVAAGDTGYSIARKTGIPFFLIQEVNPNLDWNVLSVGKQINLPSRDEILPQPVVAYKRIIVDLETRTLFAYENGQQVFSWRVSSGRDTAPTSPGIYQILSHDDLAVGSGVALCGDDNACGVWKMYWFMGIYEVRPGLINGFHGAVELPNGAFLAGGNVGGADTYGCVMSENSNAHLLYDWADPGTVVEIISQEFQPRSQLGKQTLATLQAS